VQDTDFIQRLKQGDEKAFRQLVAHHGEMIFNTCYRFLQDTDDANDIAQDVFVESYRSLKQFRSEANITTWLYRIAVNKSLNFLKKHKRCTLTDDIAKYANDSMMQEDAFAHAENEERKQVLASAIDKLPENQKTAFTLHKLEEKSYKEIAQMTVNTLPAVESLIHRAKKNLQKSLVTYYKNE
jgi:RNA polymerase sigma-70 factor (ECF subfamily)